MAVAWAVTAEKIEQAIERIVQVANPRRIIVFGSAARGETHDDSDLDVLVVLPRRPEDPRRESARIRRAMGKILMPMDILVVSESDLREWADNPSLIYQEILRTGKVVYDRGD